MSGPNWQEEAMRRLRQMQQTTGGRGGGVPPRLPRGSGAAALAGTLMVAGGFVFSNALFNVDGGHRAIKYTRLGGVSKEIYNEGEFPGVSDALNAGQRRFHYAAAYFASALLYSILTQRAPQVLISTSPGSRPPSSSTFAQSPETSPL